MNDSHLKNTYSSVVSRESICISLLLAALNEIDLLTTDTGNAYLNASPREKVCTIAGPEFGAELAGKSVLIVRALGGCRVCASYVGYVYRKKSFRYSYSSL
jgi:hypothetical protein